MRLKTFCFIAVGFVVFLYACSDTAHNDITQRAIDSIKAYSTTESENLEFDTMYLETISFDQTERGHALNDSLKKAAVDLDWCIGFLDSLARIAATLPKDAIDIAVRRSSENKYDSARPFCEKRAQLKNRLDTAFVKEKKMFTENVFYSVRMSTPDNSEYIFFLVDTSTYQVRFIKVCDECLYE